MNLFDGERVLTATETSLVRPRLEDILPDVPAKRTLMQFLELFVRPELERRKQEGRIGDGFVVNLSQAVLHPDGRQPTVRLNDEIRGVAIARLGPGSVDREYTDGSAVYMHEIDGLERFELPDDEHDCGHITMVGMRGKVALFFDARRNRARASDLIARAKNFFESAEIAFDKEHWEVFVDNLFAAAELSVKAWLWTGPLGFEFSDRMKHGAIGDAFRAWVQYGNANPRLLKTFQELTTRRPQARYKLAHKPVRRARARRWLEDVRTMVQHADLAVVSLLKAPDNYVSSSQFAI